MLKAGETSKDLKEALSLARGMVKYGGYETEDFEDLTPKEVIDLAEKLDAQFQSEYDAQRGK